MRLVGHRLNEFVSVVYFAFVSLLFQPIETALYIAVGQHLHQLGANDLLAESLLL